MPSEKVWTNYLVEGLGFDNWELGVITIASSVFSWVSLYIYKEFFFGVNWQLIYYFTTAVQTAATTVFFFKRRFSLLFLVLKMCCC